MPVYDFRMLVALTAILVGVGTLLLCLAAVDLARALCIRLWLLASPGAARQARFRDAVAAYRSHTRRLVRRKG